MKSIFCLNIPEIIVNGAFTSEEVYHFLEIIAERLNEGLNTKIVILLTKTPEGLILSEIFDAAAVEITMQKYHFEKMQACFFLKTGYITNTIQNILKVF